MAIEIPQFHPIDSKHPLNIEADGRSVIQGYIHAPHPPQQPGGVFLIKTFPADEKNTTVSWSYCDVSVETIDQLPVQEANNHTNKFMTIEKEPDPIGDDNDVILSCHTNIHDYGTLQKVKRMKNIGLIFTSLLHATEDILVEFEENTTRRLKPDDIMKKIQKYYTYDE